MTAHLHVIPPPAEPAADARMAARIGFPAAFFLAALAGAALLLGILTPPRSGPFCTGTCIAYPYSDAGQFFPRDYCWMIPGILLTPVFTLVAVCIHSCVPLRSRPWSLVAVCFSCVSTVLISMDYFTQILVVQPSLVHREMDGVALLTQYNRHGAFIALEDLGYLTLAAAFLFFGLAIRGMRGGSSIRWTLEGAAILAFASFIFMAWRFGVEMALPFELAIISIDWIALAAAGILLTKLFQRRMHEG